MSRFWENYMMILHLSHYKPQFFFLPVVYGIYRAFIGLTLILDRIFFPSFKKQKIEKPIFLIGHPRSGTTFLHRFILKNCHGLSGNLLWEMIFPSITARKIMKPFIPGINKLFAKKNVYNQHIHEALLTEAETDDAAIFFRYFSGLLPWLYLRVWGCKIDNLRTDLEKNVISSNFSKFLNNLYKKNALMSGKRLYLKNFNSILEIDNLLVNYPDAKIILLIRNAKECIPSSMSLLKNMLTNLVDYDSIPEAEKNEFYQKIFTVSRFYFYEINKIREKYSDSKNVHFVNYDSLIHDFEMQMTELLSFAGIEIDESIRETIASQSEKQKQYKGKHIYSLEDFGLDENIFDEEVFEVVEFGKNHIV